VAIGCHFGGREGWQLGEMGQNATQLPPLMVAIG